MKIGIDASRYNHELATGVEWYSWHIINNLLKALGNEDSITLYSREPLNVDGVENKVLKARRFWTLRALSGEMRKDPPDVLFVPSHVLPLNLPERSVVTVHDVAFKKLRGTYSFGEYQYLNWSTKVAVKRASKIVVPSEATKADLSKYFDCPGDKVVVVPHGFEAPKEVSDDIAEESETLKYFKIKASLKYILFVGRLETKKNLPRLVEAFAEFSKSHSDYKLILAGKRGVGFKQLLKTVDDLKILNRVIMPGYVTEEEKAFLYKHCQFFAFPSLYEGFGFPILEAFHYGKPVLCSDFSSMPEVAGEAAIYVDPEVVSSIVGGLEFLARGGEEVEELVRKGRDRLKSFSWEEAAKKTLKTLGG